MVKYMSNEPEHRVESFRSLYWGSRASVQSTTDKHQVAFATKLGFRALIKSLKPKL